MNKNDVLQIPIFQKTNIQTMKSLASFITIISYKKNMHLFLDREKMNMIYFLLEGNVNFYKIGYNEEKRSILIGKKGDIVNEECLDEGVTSSNCECLTNCTIIAIPHTKIMEACSNDPAFMMTIITSMSKKIRRLQHIIKNNMNSLTGKKRVAAKLWKLAKDYGVIRQEGIEIEIPLSITYLAELIGSKRETVSRQVKELTNEGLLYLKGKRIIIIDMDKLVNYIYST